MLDSSKKTKNKKTLKKRNFYSKKKKFCKNNMTSCNNKMKNWKFIKERMNKTWKWIKILILCFKLIILKMVLKKMIKRTIIYYWKITRIINPWWKSFDGMKISFKHRRNTAYCLLKSKLYCEKENISIVKVITSF